jgi:type IV pilus biogenesis protein CpaD/CtpE
MSVIEALWRCMRSPARPIVRRPRRRFVFLFAATTLVAGCATRPFNPPIARYDADKAHRIERQSENAEDNATLVILAFSGRAAARFACSTRST